MKRIVLSDPPEMYEGDSPKLMALVHHEVGHLLWAYYLGYEINSFGQVSMYGSRIASVKNRKSRHYASMAKWQAASWETKKLLAGEIAARRFLNLSFDEIVIPIGFPPIENVHRGTPFDTLHMQSGWGNHDGSRIMFLYDNEIHGIPDGFWRTFARIVGWRFREDNWWDWLWACHSASKKRILAHWQKQEQLVDRLIASSANGRIGGKKLIEWCRDLRFPVRKKRIISASY